MRIVLASILGCLSVLWPSIAAAQDASASATARIVIPAGISVTSSVVTQALSTIRIIGIRGDAVALGVPASLSVSNAAGQALTLNSIQSHSLFTNASVLTEDAVSVSVGTVFNGQVGNAPTDSYKGVLVVLAQYN